ncbi:MAG: hemolysin family protein [Candidatus Nanoarchaeia archaeon]
MTGIELALLVLLIVLSAFFSGVETAFVSLDRLRMQSMLDNKFRNSELVYKLKQNPHKLLSTLLIGNNLVNIGASAIATSIAIDLWGNMGVAIATGLMTFIILFFGEITPKSVAMVKADPISRFAAPFIYFLSKVLLPLLWVSDILTKKLSHVFWGNINEDRITEEEIMSFIKIGEETGGIESEEKEMIHNIFRMNDIEIRNIMIPRVKVISINGEKKIKDVTKKVINSGHSRFPVYLKEKDKITGVLFTKDLMKELSKENDSKAVKDISKEPFFVPETKRADLLLHDFRNKKVHMAVVVNEYGDVTGIVTLEDVLEEIVGEIYDETDQIEVNIKKTDKNTYEISGEVSLEEIAKKTGYVFRVKNNINTLSGFIMSKMGRIPKKGESVELKKLRLTVEGVRDNRIQKVKMVVK